ncbi:acyltransferase family protein [Streptomyces similanensis]|uniref:Acyltransferase n=1 Tax=Streptomyces similanensis TaxID=1274988 RepID=A0ABP9LH40_9ACTN|nr:acyltransferase [Streptomyces seoulensis]
MSTDVDTRRPSRLPTLTGMRFAASLMVFVCHAFTYGVFTDKELEGSLIDYVSKLGFVGVGFFFVLSGFVLTWSARDTDRPTAFWRRRLAKIFPNHLVTWALGLVLMVWLGGSAATVGNTVPSFFLVQAWFPVEDVFFGTNGPSWSLAAELLFYLSFPWLARRVRAIPERMLWLCAGLLVAGTVLVALASQLLPTEPDMPYYPISWYQYWFVYCLPVSRLLEFSLGIVMARIVLTGRWIPLGLGPALLTLIPGYALTVWLPGAYGVVAPTVVPLALIVAAGATADVQGRRSSFRTRAAVLLGELSFAFYMVHMLVMWYGPMGRVPGRTWDTLPALGVIVLDFALTLLAAWLLYRAVEVPAVRRLSGARGRGGSPPPAHPGRRDGAASTPVAG